MNVGKAIEIAFSSVLRKYCQLGEKTVVRAWQSLEDDGSWDANKDREFPCIDIRCSPPKPDEVQATLSSECAMMIFTQTAEDKSHKDHSDIQSEVERVLFALFKQFRKRTLTEPEIADFIAALNANLPAESFVFNGLTWVDGNAPFNEGTLNASSYGMAVRWSNPQFAY